MFNVYIRKHTTSSPHCILMIPKIGSFTQAGPEARMPTEEVAWQSVTSTYVRKRVWKAWRYRVSTKNSACRMLILIWQKVLQYLHCDWGRRGNTFKKPKIHWPLWLYTMYDRSVLLSKSAFQQRDWQSHHCQWPKEAKCECYWSESDYHIFHAFSKLQFSNWKSPGL